VRERKSTKENARESERAREGARGRESVKAREGARGVCKGARVNAREREKARLNIAHPHTTPAKFEHLCSSHVGMTKPMYFLHV